MSSRRFAAIFIAIFILGALPLLLVQPSGTGSAGLSAGFIIPFSAYHLIPVGMIGMWGIWLGKDAILMLPLTFILMLAISCLIGLNDNDVRFVRLFVLGAILLFALIIAVTPNRAFLLSTAVTSSFAFHLGDRYISHLPEIASPLHYIIGLVLCISLVLAVGMSLGLTLVEEFAKLKERLRQLPTVSSFMSFF